MDLMKMIQAGELNVILTTTNDLLRFAQAIVEQTMSELEAVIAEGKSEVYYSPEQVMTILNVSRRTLFRWQKPECNKYLMPVNIGGLARYRKSDIDRITDAR